MSYRLVPTFKCSMCGAEEPSRLPFIGPFWHLLPYHWRGSARKFGTCYCDTCSKAITELIEADFPSRAEAEEGK